MRGISVRASLVVLAALVIGLAGCGDDPKKPGASGGSATSGPSATASAGGSADPSGAPGGAPSGSTGGGGTATGNDKAVCDEQEKLVADSTRRFGEEIVKSATGEGGEQAAVAAVKKLFSDWAAGMRTQAGKTSNPELKSALTEYATGLDKVNSQINGVADLEKLGDLNTAEIESATDKLLRICG